MTHILSCPAIQDEKSSKCYFYSRNHKNNDNNNDDSKEDGDDDGDDDDDDDGDDDSNNKNTGSSFQFLTSHAIHRAEQEWIGSFV